MVLYYTLAITELYVKMGVISNRIVLYFLFILSTSLYSQESPPIKVYTADEYDGENQNWMISQNSDNYIYIANSGGLLEFNGEKWRMYPSPNGSDIRSLKVVDDRIYIGCFEEFGYWEKDVDEELKYHSLISSIDIESIVDDNIWSIVPFEEWIIFQSQRNMYFFNTKTREFRIISSNNIITKVFIIKNIIYYHVMNEGVFIIENGVKKLLIESSEFNEDRLINILELNDNLLFQTHRSGFYLYKKNKLKKWNTPINKYITKVSHPF